MRRSSALDGNTHAPHNTTAEAPHTITRAQHNQQQHITSKRKAHAQAEQQHGTWNKAGTHTQAHTGTHILTTAGDAGHPDAPPETAGVAQAIWPCEHTYTHVSHAK